ncbi:GTP-binding protein [Humidesulfovibrio mexicanus]|uniref:GTPase Der n=1 Tax=Humidesulfovibrio mexicanus TaxID=147047 RepID=A0A238XZ64_9BACT|nr:ribosome biogenesis GTPase Der [Humidesulfovibrio mexicanus]SNR64177.1 GTP-binding protein [Humidesulfovibrio mexicanus]
MLPIIALLGRPNVGKSSLFNRLVRQNKAITHDLPGVTRDRIYGEATEDEVRFAVIDTGGMLPDAAEHDGGGMDRSVFQQAVEALDEADVALFVVDGRDGMTGLDQAVSEKIRASGKPVLLVVNKVDGPEQEAKALADFHALGFEIAPVSAAHGYGLSDLRLRVAELARPFVQPAPADGPELGLKLCMLGRPNAGKSSLVNALVGEARQIVSDIAGTTRDSVDIGFEKDGRRYTFVDTAGVRRRAVITDHLEKLSVFRALSSSKRADVTILVLDAVQGLSHQDKRLIAYLAEQRTPFMVAVNKVDLVHKTRMDELRAAYEEALRICAHVPVLYVSALTGAGTGKILSLAEEIRRECVIRIGTGQLNRAMAEAITKHQPPVIKRRRAKFYYLTQADEDPPMFVFFVNDSELVTSAYGKYLEGQLRKLLGIRKAPLAAVFRSSHEKKEAERPLTNRAPRLGKDRRDMAAAKEDKPHQSAKPKPARTSGKARAGSKAAAGAKTAAARRKG